MTKKQLNDQRERLGKTASLMGTALGKEDLCVQEVAWLQAAATVLVATTNLHLADVIREKFENKPTKKEPTP